MKRRKINKSMEQEIRGDIKRNCGTKNVNQKVKNIPIYLYFISNEFPTCSKNPQVYYFWSIYSDGT